MSLPVASIKVVLLGDTGVGKSSLALRFASNEFKPYSESTIGASFMTKQIELPVDRFASGNSSESDQLAETENDTETRKVEFKIWDTAGQEKYQSLAPMYYRGAAAAIVVYDICSLPSFRMLQKWIDEMKTNGPPAIVIAICGNKSDLEEKRQVPKDEAEKYSQKMGGFYVETSARDDSNVKGLFEEIARRVPILEEGEGISAAEDGVGALSLGIKKSSRGRCCYS